MSMISESSKKDPRPQIEGRFPNRSARPAMPGIVAALFGMLLGAGCVDDATLDSGESDSAEDSSKRELVVVRGSSLTSAVWSPCPPPSQGVCWLGVTDSVALNAPKGSLISALLVASWNATTPAAESLVVGASIQGGQSVSATGTSPLKLELPVADRYVARAGPPAGGMTLNQEVQYELALLYLR